MKTRREQKYANGTAVLLNDGTRGVIFEYLPTYTPGRVEENYLIRTGIGSFAGTQLITRSEGDIMLDRCGA